MSKKKLIQVSLMKWNVINAGLAGLLVLLGAFTTTNELSRRAIVIALATSLLVAFTKFRDFWQNEEKKLISPMFDFLP